MSLMYHIRQTFISIPMLMVFKSKTISRLNLYQTLMKSGPGYSQIFKFGQLMCSFNFDYVLESLQHEMNLRKRILHLQDFRRNGLNKFVLASMIVWFQRRVQFLILLVVATGTLLLFFCCGYYIAAANIRFIGTTHILTVTSTVVTFSYLSKAFL